MTSEFASAQQAAGTEEPRPDAASQQVRYQTASIDGVDLFYREAGPKDAPVILLLHGFPTSSHMYRNLIPALSDRYRVIAPDYPGFGQTAAPDRGAFAYTFDNYATLIEKLTETLGVTSYVLYVFDYGAPVGLQVAVSSLFYALYFRLQHVAGPVYLSQIGYVGTAFGLPLAVLAFGDRVTPQMLGGTLLVALGVLLTRPVLAPSSFEARRRGDAEAGTTPLPMPPMKGPTE